MKKIIICLILAIFLSLSFASASIWDKIQLYYDFNSTEELVSGIYNLTNNEGSPTFTDVIAVIGKSGNITTNNNWIISLNNGFNLGEGDKSVNFWVRGNSSSINESNTVFLCWESAVYLLQFNTNRIYWVNVFDSGNYIEGNVVEDIWYMVTIVHDGNNASTYLNGNLLRNELSGLSDVDSGVHIGVYWEDNFDFGGYMDEMGWWNRSLDSSEILDLYNDGNGLGYGLEAERVTINLISPSNNSLIPDVGSNFTANYTTVNHNLTNTTYYIWNSTGLFNQTTVSITGTSNSTTLYIDEFIIGSYKWNVFTCYKGITYSNCNFADSNYTLEVGVVIGTEFYNNETYEAVSETFSLNITLISGTSLYDAQLFYNNNYYTAPFTNLGNNKYYISKTITTPTVLTTTIIPFNWILTYDFEGGMTQNTTSKNQTVFDINIDNCSINTNIIYNFTIVDEENQELIPFNNSIEILVNMYSIDRSVLFLNYSGSFNTSSTEICINRNLSNFTSAYSFDSTVKYSAQDHEVEYYNIVNYSLTNQSQVQNIILYDLLTSDSTEFQLTFTGSDFLAVENALVFVKRQYISENVFKVVELPKTDSNGQTILHLVRNDIIYNIEIMKGGVVIGNFENIIAFCYDVVIGDCKITLSAAEAGEAIFSYDDELGITYTGPTYDDTTRIITFNFLTTDGSVKAVLMNATRNDIFGNRSICSASIVSSGGTLTCEVPSYIEDSIIITKIFVNGKETLKDYTVLSEFNYGKAGYFIFFVYMLAFILMFSKSKTTMLIGIIVGFVVGVTLGLISGRLVGIGASGVWLIIVVILMVWKLNKERPN